MQLIRRDVDLSSLAGMLSLVVANYKPVPQLPMSTSNLPSNQSMINSGATGTGNAFQVQTPAESMLGNQSWVEEWGEPSLLYLPKGNSTSDESASGDDNTATAARSAGANSFASTTVGPGNCPVASSYSPTSSLPDPIFPPFDSVQANIMRYRQQQSVNLGNWFVAENWMSSTYFQCSTGSKAAEIDILQGFGTSSTGLASAKAFMEKHWDTWVTEADFQMMASMGINTVRLPIGYWSVGPWFCRNSPFAAYSSVYEYSWRYVARAINWAAKYDIGVLVDLHGAYGSQNGQAHSGTSDGQINFFSDTNKQLTTEVLKWIANEISDVTNVVGIQLLNEPVDRQSLWTWYNSTMDAMRAVSPYAKTVPLYFHDAFVLEKGAQFVSQRPDFVVQDHHSYYVYTASDTSTSAQGHTSQISGPISQWLSTQSNVGRRNLIVGEWSCALNPNSLTGSKNPEADQRSFCEAQANVYSSVASGWTFWSWRMESCSSNGGWCFKQAVKQYLPSSFDSWNLTSQTSSYFQSALAIRVGNGNANSSTSSSGGASSDRAVALLDRLTNLTVPSASTIQLNVKLATSYAATNGGNDGEGTTFTEEELGDAPLLSAPTSKSPPASTSVKTRSALDAGAQSRVGMVQTRGSGSGAARASAWSRRSSQLQQLFAAQSGFNDGYKSAKYFATSSSGSLSRLGFVPQYVQDSWAARVATGRVVAGDADKYEAQFESGRSAAEKAIRAVITGTA